LLSSALAYHQLSAHCQPASVLIKHGNKSTYWVRAFLPILAMGDLRASTFNLPDCNHTFHKPTSPS
jgi:hypothetical protein